MKDLLLFARPPKPRTSPDRYRAAGERDRQPAEPRIPRAATWTWRSPGQRRRAGGRRDAPDRVPEPAHQRRPRDARERARSASPSRPGLDLPDRVHRRRPGDSGEIRDKIFTPFFTTKSRGSGLGLPTAKRLVEAHNGQIAIDCPPAGGTTVVVRLPTA